MTAPTTPAEGQRHRVVVDRVRIRGSVRHQGPQGADVDVTMIAKTTHHLFQPLLYQVATGILSEGEIAPPTREILSGQKNAQVLLGTVTGIDLDRAHRHLARARPRDRDGVRLAHRGGRARPSPTSATTSSASTPPA